MSQSILLVFSALLICSLAIPVPQFGLPPPWHPPGGFPFTDPFTFVFGNKPPPFTNINQIASQNGVGAGVVAISSGANGGGFLSTVNGQGTDTNHQIFVVSTQQNGDKPHTQIFGNVNGQDIYKEV